MQFQFSSLMDFWMMNGHGPYVWSAYAITFTVLGFLVISARYQRRVFLQSQRKAQRLAQQQLNQNR